MGKCRSRNSSPQPSLTNLLKIPIKTSSPTTQQTKQVIPTSRPLSISLPNPQQHKINNPTLKSPITNSNPKHSRNIHGNDQIHRS